MHVHSNDPPVAPRSDASTRPDNQPVGFCQQCGRPLTAATRRVVGDGTYCEPCAAVRFAQGGWSPVTGAAMASGEPIAPQPSGEPKAKLAGVLGFIPGVGAMYNGQYAKAAVHLVIFVVLLSLADNLSDTLYWLVWGWVFYQVFEAYHTALARQEGRPLPDPFGWNDLGDRLGFQRTSPVSPHPTVPFSASTAGPAPVGSPPPHESATTPRSSYPPPAATSTVDPGTFPNGDAHTTYTPVIPEPSNASGALPVDFASAHPSTQVPFAQTYVGAAPFTPPPPAPVLMTTRRFPVGALWLILLGAIFLAGNIVPNWRLSARWVLPVLLAVAALWAGTARVLGWRERVALGGVAAVESLSDALLFPAVLFTFAILLMLQNGGSLRLAHSWPALLIVWGAVLLLGRLPSFGAAAERPDAHPGDLPS